MQQEPIRAFALAQQLNVETRDLLEAAQALGIDLRNHLSQVPPDRQAALEDHVRKTIPQLAESAQPIIPIAPDADADDLDDLDDLDEDDFDEDDEDSDDEDDDDEEGTGGGYRVDHTEGKQYQEDYEPEEDDKDAGDYEAEGPEEYGCDPDYD